MKYTFSINYIKLYKSRDTFFPFIITKRKIHCSIYLFKSVKKKKENLNNL